VNPKTGQAVEIRWHDGPRAPLRQLFELADDSSTQIDGYIELGRVLVARDEHGDTVGHLQLIPTARRDTIELKSIAVREDHRRGGIGRRLVERALAICRDEGARAITVATATADIDNLRFYQRRGFRAIAVEWDVFTEAKGYPPQLQANGIPVRDSITFTLLLHAAAPD
jgi:GNAT superfamily N-acetyltransferase